ncbi:hypothetical protein Desaci_1574 [Desulfosporosinus acidiphilus SJ4]|uniref:Ethanolamine utilization cobalamin adenosyltransferase n=1 Tax=Desulfosporosinus acidiphilus (strain DSM 22704 / JCM 16185 / SJ4) TaxID=646529 RepID=I4D454_DESAJ|nr:hypothetical protein [Desulfosporosinus acidiphilus]AFM40578.1 hypothetical protein Desaci_1574 [Desulfosporosinus acidiphilus SJ4]
MKFITEMELRERYKAEPFTTYFLEHQIKITPGARQFLVDRGVKLVQAQGRDDGGAKKSGNENSLQVRQSWLVQRLQGKMECLKALLLMVGSDLLKDSDAERAEEVLDLARYFQSLITAEREGTVPDDIKFWGWAEEEIKTCADNLGKFFEINDFHARLENGKTMTALNYIHASLCEMEPAILKVYWVEELGACSRQDLIDKVHLINNILCIMMWKCLGGQK